MPPLPFAVPEAPAAGGRWEPTARPTNLALASLFAFCELNNRTIDSRVLDEKSAENLFKRAAGHRDLGIPPENVFREIREVMNRAIVTLQ